MVSEEDEERKVYVKKFGNTISAREELRKCQADNLLLKAMLKALSKSGAQNARVHLKAEIFAAKHVQRLLNIDELLVISGNPSLAFRAEEVGQQRMCILRKFLPTTVKMVRDLGNKQVVKWCRGDKGIFVFNEVRPNEPLLTGSEVSNSNAVEIVRQPDFTGSEFGRLLHVLGDPRMMAAREQLTQPRMREELDGDLSTLGPSKLSLCLNM